MLQIRTVRKNSRKAELADRLYQQAFPESERIPMSFLLRKAKKDFVDFLAFYDADEFIGFAYMISHNDITFVQYLAIDPSRRSKGYGGAVLSLISEKYRGNRLVLNIEETGVAAENAEQRAKRKRFYLNHGYRNAQYRMVHGSEGYEVLIKGDELIPYELLRVFKTYMGRLMYLFFKPKLIPINAVSAMTRTRTTL